MAAGLVGLLRSEDKKPLVVWVGGANHAKGVSCLRRMTDPIRKAASTHCDMVQRPDFAKPTSQLAAEDIIHMAAGLVGLLRSEDKKPFWTTVFCVGGWCESREGRQLFAKND
jgi:hypothetical protein